MPQVAVLLNIAPLHYQTLASECLSKLMTMHMALKSKIPFFLCSVPLWLQTFWDIINMSEIQSKLHGMIQSGSFKFNKCQGA